MVSELVEDDRTMTKDVRAPEFRFAWLTVWLKGGHEGAERLNMSKSTQLQTV